MSRNLITVAAILAFGYVAVVTACSARSEEAPSYPCPSGAPSCKVITITPTEEQALVHERGILTTAKQGRPLDLGDAVDYFREKIKAAPAGKPEPKPEK